MHFNKRWGYLSRAGVNDKSQLMRQIEKYAGEALGLPCKSVCASEVDSGSCQLGGQH